MSGTKNIMNRCFVCQQAIEDEEKTINKITNLPVCNKCKGTEAEKKAEQEALDSLAEGFVCGCI
jgi:NAD-dependent SIR2 family protein deacetylase